MVDRRLQGEQWMVPARLYARPLTLRTGMHFTSDALVNVLNGLKYEQKTDGPPAPGQFVAGSSLVAFYPRPVKGGPDEPVAVMLEKPKPPVVKPGVKPPPAEPEHIKEIRGLQTQACVRHAHAWSPS